MERPGNEVAQVIRKFIQPFIQGHQPNSYTLHILDQLAQCRTAALGGHKERCDCCGKERITYNSCRNRCCPKCQSARQAFWVEDRMKQAPPVKHFHLVFTVPYELNEICMLNSGSFYSTMLSSVWDTLRTLGYSHYGVETGTICVLHTWGENLSLHPHIHCIVPALGLTLNNRLKHITKEGNYLYPGYMLAEVFRGKLLAGIKRQRKKDDVLRQYQLILDIAYRKRWVVHCEAPFCGPEQIVGYLSQYIHRIAISNRRILRIDDTGVTFRSKDYRDQKRCKVISLGGTEFLRRFCMHILPKGFVRIRYYGILSSRAKANITVWTEKPTPEEKTITKETSCERLLRLTGFSILLCPFCKEGRMQITGFLPPIRAPGESISNPHQ
jgi:hypothetical protein